MIVQDKYEIDDDLITKITTGEYIRCGSVVRHANGPNRGKFVMFLKPIDQDSTEKTRRLGSKVFQVVQQHKVGAVIVGSAAVAGACLWGYSKWRNREPKVLVDFRAALKSYIDAIRNGNLNMGEIDALLCALNNLRKYKNYEKICIQLSAEDFEILVEHIYNYTKQLAANNNIAIADERQNASNSAINKLRLCLKEQKKMFLAA